MATIDEVSSLISEAMRSMSIEVSNNLNEIRSAIQLVQPQRVEQYVPVTIDPNVNNNNNSLHLIKSLPEFKGEASEYPAWREAAHFAMNYYKEGSENYYIATGILRNKITSAVNLALSSFNTVLHIKAIIERLDQSYAYKRPIHVLESELSILRQGKSTIKEFYDSVDRQLTLIINKNNMGSTGNQQITVALHERARDYALRVFISGLRRPSCDILFSAKPIDMPSALALAQEVEYNQKRSEFARSFASISTVQNPNKLEFDNTNTQNPNSDNRILNQNKRHQYLIKRNNEQNTPVPMEVDPGSSLFKRQKPQSSNKHQISLNNNPVKNDHEQLQSIRRTPFSQQKTQAINHMQEDSHSDNGNSIFEQDDDCVAYDEEIFSNSDEEINILG